jgi:hypothetical protein
LAININHPYLGPYLQLAINASLLTFVAVFLVGYQHQPPLSGAVFTVGYQRQPSHICGRIYSWLSTSAHPHFVAVFIVDYQDQTILIWGRIYSWLSTSAYSHV